MTNFLKSISLHNSNEYVAAELNQMYTKPNLALSSLYLDIQK